MKDSEKKAETITVDGVVLSKEGIEFLEMMQEEENAYIIETRQMFDRAIGLMADGMAFIAEPNPTEAIEVIKSIAIFQRFLSHLMKPNS